MLANVLNLSRTDLPRATTLLFDCLNTLQLDTRSLLRKGLQANNLINQDGKPLIDSEGKMISRDQRVSPSK